VPDGSSTQEFALNRAEIEQRIDELYELEYSYVEAQAEGDDTTPLDAQYAQLRLYFEKIADHLWKLGVYKSRDEARSAIRADTDVLQHAGGPGGVRPDDGVLDSNEIAEGLVALGNLNQFSFQAPLCFKTGVSDLDFTYQAGDMKLVAASRAAEVDCLKFLCPV
jgi:hypothetical protein